MPSYPKPPGASGAHKGLTPDKLKAAGWDHLPWEVVVVVASGEASLLEMSTVISTAGAYDLLDMIHIRDSWKAATVLNSMETHG